VSERMRLAGGRGEMAAGEQLDRPTTLEREGEEKPTTHSHGPVERATTTTKHEPWVGKCEGQCCSRHLTCLTAKSS
jgi:hypothetical protein